MFGMAPQLGVARVVAFLFNHFVDLEVAFLFSHFVDLGVASHYIRFPRQLLVELSLRLEGACQGQLLEFAVVAFPSMAEVAGLGTWLQGSYSIIVATVGLQPTIVHDQAASFVTKQVTGMAANYRDHLKTTVVAAGNSADCCSFSIGSCCLDIIGYFDHIRSCSTHNCSLTDFNFDNRAGNHTTGRSAMDSFSRHTAMRPDSYNFSSGIRTAAYFSLDQSVASSLHIERIMQATIATDNSAGCIVMDSLGCIATLHSTGCCPIHTLVHCSRTLVAAIVAVVGNPYFIATTCRNFTSCSSTTSSSSCSGQCNLASRNSAGTVRTIVATIPVGQLSNRIVRSECSVKICRQIIESSDPGVFVGHCRNNFAGSWQSTTNFLL